MLPLLAAALLPALLPVALAADPEVAVVVPYHRAASGHVVIEAALTGGPVSAFVVDTGASVTVLTPETWVAAGRDPREGLAVRGRGAGGAVGGARVVPGVDLVVAGQPVEVGAAVVMVLPSLGPDEPPLAGLLGRDVLRRHVVELDDVAGEMTLHPNHAVIATGDDVVVLPMRRVRGGLTAVEVEVAGHRVDAILDIGASVSVLNDAARALTGVAPAEGCGGEILGADGTAVQVDCVRADSVRLGALDLGAYELTAADLDIFRVLRMSKRPAMFLGNDILAGRRLVLDDGRRTLTLSRTVHKPASPAGE